MIPAVTNMDPVAPKAGEDVNLDKIVDVIYLITKINKSICIIIRINTLKSP